MTLRDDLRFLQDALFYLDEVYTVGADINHKTYGPGVIVEKNGSTIAVKFANGDTKKLGLVLSAANHIITAKCDGYEERICQYKDILKKESSIKNAVGYAEKSFAPYAEYID